MAAGKLRAGLHRAENLLSFLLLALLALMPFVGVIARLLSLSGIRSSADYIQHLVLWVAFLGGAITSREGKHLALTVGSERAGPKLKQAIDGFTGFLSAFICTILTLASASFVAIGFDPGARIGVFPVWIAALALPVGFLLMTVRAVARSSERPVIRWIAGAGVVAGLLAGFGPVANTLWSFGADGIAAAAAVLQTGVAAAMNVLHVPLVLALIAAALLGAPVFVLLGGLAVLFFTHSGGSLEVIPNEAYTMLSGPTIPALPLFTLAGFIISESKAGERLVRLFRALFGWLPGGLAIMSVVICAFLTTFTGASGVTILAVGSLLMFILTAGSYQERFSTGLLTSAGSIGLLFPPSLPIILYAVIAQVSIKDMFVGGLLPGFFMVLTLSAMGVVRAVRDKIPRVAFVPSEAVRSILPSLGEVLLPFFILLLFLGGVMTIVETAAFAVVYALVLEVAVHRDIPWKKVPEVFFKSGLIVGGVLAILSVAKGLSYYIVDAEIPMRLTDWLLARVGSKYIFLALLNVALLIVGCFLDIFSAITVVVPLIIPLGVAYGVNPVHLGIIFLANLELGYLTPPVGMNLFLASYAFNKPLGAIYRYVVPFLIVELGAVLVITYMPWLTTVLLGILKL
ncbi:MAG: TRAP transporter large permease subunit [Spirochaetes bacterium]|nr:TRAP transporter large permease subunit [Spirochaetota bacterium]